MKACLQRHCSWAEAYSYKSFCSFKLVKVWFEKMFSPTESKTFTNWFLYLFIYLFIYLCIFVDSTLLL